MLWFICIGFLLIFVMIITATLKHLPLTTAILYVCFGFILPRTFDCGPVGGLAVGTFLATCISKLIIHLRRKHKETQSLDDFLALGLISLTYGIALCLKVYGFLAVFAAGLALRRGERIETQQLDAVEDADETRNRWDSASWTSIDLSNL